MSLRAGKREQKPTKRKFRSCCFRAKTHSRQNVPPSLEAHLGAGDVEELAQERLHLVLARRDAVAQLRIQAQQVLSRPPHPTTTLLHVVRQHQHTTRTQSNHIMIVVDLRSATFYQKCYDPDCQAIDYRSPEYALPPDICPTTTVFSSSVPPTATTHEQPIINNSNGDHYQLHEDQDNDDDRFLSDETLYQSIMDNPSLWP